MVAHVNKQTQKVWDNIFQKCAELIYSQIADKGWNQKHIGGQGGYF